MEWEDYGARMQDPQLGRWNGIDEKAEEYYDFNPYHYAANNPIKYVDKDGKGIWDVVVGFVVASVDNFTGGLVNGREACQPAGGQALTDYKSGQTSGDVTSAVSAVAEGMIGEGLKDGGTAATVGTG